MVLRLMQIVNEIHIPVNPLCAERYTRHGIDTDATTT